MHMHYCGHDIQIQSVISVSVLLTDMPLHGKHSMFLLHLIGRTQIKLRRKLPHLPLTL